MFRNKKVLREAVELVMAEQFYLSPDLDEEGRPVKNPPFIEPFEYLWFEDEVHHGGLMMFSDGMLELMAARLLGIEPDQLPDTVDPIDAAFEASRQIMGRYLMIGDPEAEVRFVEPAQVSMDLNQIPFRLTYTFVSEGQYLQVKC